MSCVMWPWRSLTNLITIVFFFYSNQLMMSASLIPSSPVRLQWTAPMTPCSVKAPIKSSWCVTGASLNGHFISYTLQVLVNLLNWLVTQQGAGPHWQDSITQLLRPWCDSRFDTSQSALLGRVWPAFSGISREWLLTGLFSVLDHSL